LARAFSNAGRDLPYKIRFKDGTLQKIQLFGYTLPFSTRKFYRGYLSDDTHALMTGHVEAFEHLGGLASCCKYDGQKAAVLRWEGQQPIYKVKSSPRVMPRRAWAGPFGARAGQRPDGQQSPRAGQLIARSRSRKPRVGC